MVTACLQCSGYKDWLMKLNLSTNLWEVETIASRPTSCTVWVSKRGKETIGRHEHIEDEKSMAIKVQVLSLPHAG